LTYLSVSLFHAPAPPEIYTLSLHDALPIFAGFAWLIDGIHGFTQPSICSSRTSHVPSVGNPIAWPLIWMFPTKTAPDVGNIQMRDRKSTRLNSSHLGISYAVFCLKKKKRGT